MSTGAEVTTQAAMWGLLATQMKWHCETYIPYLAEAYAGSGCHGMERLLLDASRHRLALDGVIHMMYEHPESVTGQERRRLKNAIDACDEMLEGAVTALLKVSMTKL